MRITAEPRSDQWNADDFVGSARTFTIAGVKPGAAEQKYDIALVEGEGRVWRPPLTVLRLLIHAWGDEAQDWVGRRVRLYCDRSVTFGRDKVGGIRISHLSDLPGGKRLEVMLTVSRGKRELFRVEPLPDVAPAAERPPTALDHLSSAMRYAGWDKARVEAVVGHPLSAFGDLTEAEAQACLDAIRAEQDGPADDVPAGHDGEQGPVVEDPPYDEAQS